MVAPKAVKPLVPSPPEKVTPPEVQAPSPFSPQLLHRATHLSSALTPRDILTLQRTIGNRAVGAMLQRKLDVKKLAKAGISVPQLATWQADGGLSATEVEKIVFKLEPAQLALAVGQMPAGRFKGIESGEIVEKFLTLEVGLKSRAMGAALAAAAAVVYPPAVETLRDRGIRTEDAQLFFEINGGAAVTALLASTADFPLLVSKINAANKNRVGIAAINTLLTTENPHGYDAAFLVGWVQRKDLATVRDALRATAVENNQTYLDLWLTHNVSATNRVQWTTLLRFQARLRTTGAALTVFQPDEPYAGSEDPPSRTGFLRYDFGGAMMEVHTHWNTSRCRLVSMHVQYNGTNGVEINKRMELFADVVTAVMTAHNNAAGINADHAPTTVPVGQALTL